ncbi:MAG: sigma factor [Actinomycetes bacterium]
MDLGDEPLLTATEETALAQAIEAGVLAEEALGDRRRRAGASPTELRLLADLGEQARQRFVRANLRLVAAVARPAAVRTGLAESDVFQEGCLGLLAAVARFDHRRGYRFSTYALCWIRAYVGAATSSAFGALNVPTSRADALHGLRGVETELTQVLGRSPTVPELAAALGRTERWVATATAYTPPQALEDGNANQLGVNVVEVAVLEAARPGRELLAHLAGLDRQVIEMRLGFAGDRPYTYAETARRLAISVNRVRRVEERALEQLRAVCPVGARIHL